jgi:MinD superfamily P-loop ATPase
MKLSDTLYANVISSARFAMITFRKDICDHCGACVSVCPRDAILLYEREIKLLTERCDGCRRCLIVCPLRAVEAAK